MFAFKIITLLLSVFRICYGDENKTTDILVQENTATTTNAYPLEGDKDKIETLIMNIKNLTTSLEVADKEGNLPLESKEAMYDDINDYVSNIIDLMNDHTNLYWFHKLRGIDRVILKNLDVPYSTVQYNILNLIKTMIKLAPATVNTIIPPRILNRILDIFETDDNVSLKNIIVDILCEYLPGNPRGQARVMKVKGLVPFYEQMTRLDERERFKLLELYNKILEEHINMRNTDIDKNLPDAAKLKLYESIGIFEIMSQKSGCLGFFEIIKNVDVFSSPIYAVRTILELTTKVAPYCFEYYVQEHEVEEVFRTFLRFLTENNEMGNTSLQKSFSDYIRRLNVAKTEL